MSILQGSYVKIGTYFYVEFTDFLIDFTEFLVILKIHEYFM